MKRFFSLLISFVTLSLVCTAQQKNIPDIQFSDTENIPVSKKNIPEGKPLLLVYFRSDCDHCQHTATILRESATRFPTEIWMVSGEEMEAVRSFEEMLDLYDISNLKVLQDRNHEMHRFYNFTKLPFVLLYSRSGVLLKQFEELPTPAEVRKVLTDK